MMPGCFPADPHAEPNLGFQKAQKSTLIRNLPFNLESNNLRKFPNWTYFGPTCWDLKRRPAFHTRPAEKPISFLRPPPLPPSGPQQPLLSLQIFIRLELKLRWELNLGKLTQLQWAQGFLKLERIEPWSLMEGLDTPPPA